MHELLLVCLGLILSISFLTLLARKVRIAYPIFLVVAGLALGFLPWTPNIRIDPNLVFLLILPPILFDAAFNSSWRALWRWRRIILVMAIGFVLATATAVAFVAHWLIPGFSLAQGFLLGAIISPPDAAAATAVLQYVKLPKGLVSILEGESLLNDATSLTLYRFALAAIMTNHFVWHEAILGFLGVSLLGVVIGLAFGFLFYAIYKWLPTTANLDIALSLVLPYLIYLTAEGFHASGVLAVVAGGLFIAYQNHFIFSHSSRLKSSAIWPAIVFILNAVLFFLIGLQLPVISDGIKSLSLRHSLFIAGAITLTIIIVRMAAGYFSSVFTVFISRYITVAYNKPGWRNPTIIGWTGMRGVVSLASALGVPLALGNGAAFPHRSLILFITFVAILVTLVGQGLALPWIIRMVKPEMREGETTDEEQVLHIEAQLLRAAHKRLEEKYQDDIKTNTLIKNKLDLLKCKIALYDDADTNEKCRAKLNEMTSHFQQVLMEITEHQRKELHTFRHKDHFDDDVIALIERRLDLEEERIQDDDE